MNKHLEITTAPVHFGKNDVTITIPKDYAKYLNIGARTKEIFLVPTDGVIQISGSEPISTIPALTEDNMDFELQRT